MTRTQKEEKQFLTDQLQSVFGKKVLWFDGGSNTTQKGKITGFLINERPTNFKPRIIITLNTNQSLVIDAPVHKEDWINSIKNLKIVKGFFS